MRIRKQSNFIKDFSSFQSQHLIGQVTCCADAYVMLFTFTDVHRIVELESVISNGSLTARFDIPEEHLLHVSPNANPVIVNHHYEEGGNCEWFNQPTSVRNCSESSTISWNRGRAGVSDDTVTVTLTIPYNASIAATKEWRIRANVPRHDCDLPLRYLLVIAPREFR